MGLPVAAATGCTANIPEREQDDPGAPVGGSTGKPTTPPRNGGAGGSAMMPLPPREVPGVSAECNAAPPNPGPAFARRLTRFEYNNTIRDLGLPYSGSEPPAAGFPAEEKRAGFDNNAEISTVSPLLSEQYMLAAERIATAAVDNPMTLMNTLLQGCVLSPTTENTCAESFFTKFGRRVYRRPPLEEELTILRNVYKVGRETDFATGIKLALMTMLQSPRFLYRLEFGVTPKPGETVVRLDPYETASRLSYLIWAGPPDTALLDAAGRNELVTPEQIKVQIDRMLSPAMENASKLKRAKDMVANFHEQWFELHHVLDLEKDTTVYKKFNKAILGNWHRETERFLDWAFWDGGGDLKTMLTAPVTFADEALTKFYGTGMTYPVVLGMDGKPITTIQKVDTDGKTRAGLLTHGSILGMWAGSNQTSPVLRGKFVREQLLCQVLPSPPNDVVIELPALDPKLTTRERFSKHQDNDGCRACHTLMDPIGLGFEKYDGIGIYRELENGRAVDATGEVIGMTAGKFNGVLELAQRLAQSDEANNCVTLKWFQYAYGRDYLPEKGDSCTMEKLRRQFALGEYKFRNLLVALATSDAFLYRRVTAPGGDQ